MLLICLGHFWKADSTLPIYHFYLGVEFFFIVSGVFLYKAYEKHPSLSAINFTKNRFKKLFPEYFIVLLLVFIIDVFYYNIRNIDISWIEYIHHFIVMSLMVEDIGFFPGQLPAGPLWFLCALIIAGYFIFALLRRYGKKYSDIWIPLSVILIFTYIFTHYSHVSMIEDTAFCFHLPLFRGYADMCLGVMLGRVIFDAQGLKLFRKWILDGFSILSIVLLVLAIISKKAYDQYAMIYIIVIVAACLDEASLLNKVIRGGFWNYLGGITFEMLLLHMPLKTFYFYVVGDSVLSEGWPSIVAYVVALIVVSIAFKYLYGLVKGKIDEVLFVEG